MLANDEPNADIRGIPKGFEAALTFNIEILLKWANQHKAEKCLPVFYRMNIAGEQFRVHIVPASNQEITEASESLAERIPGLAGVKGGFLHYLGGREHLAGQRGAEFRKSARNKEAIDQLMQDGGIPTLVSQLKNIVVEMKDAPG
ncbi:MAG: hypothetical protein EPO02_02170 [Nitrospirae bacterium]|nr:MAG: hypothetical protein EPO02_02170 [Nitrospirota bacterium]